jgi:hypothetical protein
MQDHDGYCRREEERKEGKKAAEMSSETQSDVGMIAFLIGIKPTPSSISWVP